MFEIVDQLTGVHSRRSFMALLRRHVVLANGSQTTLALVVVDINGFAAINGACGYEFGDKLLQHVARQLVEVARGHDYVARIGDNCFALILPRIMNQGHAELAIQKLFRRLDVPFEVGQKRIKMGVTVGVALCPQHATQVDFLLRKAELSLRAARTSSERFLFSPESEKDRGLSEFWDIELELAGAIERDEMFMLYQPKVRCSDRVTVGGEALMRWNSRSRGAVSPSVFIPVAEQTGQIKNMTIWAVNTALRHASEWVPVSGEVSVSVNVPPQLMARHDLPELVENALKLWGSEHVKLVLEITERSLIPDPMHSFRLLSKIRELGVSISIDDFGTGYSCLAYFKDIPADELKIDRSFVCALLDDSASAAIASLIIDLAHRFDMSVVAEGVEDEAIFEALRERGCDVVQGWLFAKAMRHDEFAHWLRAGAALPAVSVGLPVALRPDIPDLV